MSCGANAVCSFSETKWWHAQIVKEMLEVVYGFETFHHYTHGRKVSLVTDHKALVAICSKPLSRAPKRLQNLLTISQHYDISIQYKSAREIPIADSLSWATTSKLEKQGVPRSQQSQIATKTKAPTEAELLYDNRGPKHDSTCWSYWESVAWWQTATSWNHFLTTGMKWQSRF